MGVSSLRVAHARIFATTALALVPTGTTFVSLWHNPKCVLASCVAGPPTAQQEGPHMEVDIQPLTARDLAGVDTLMKRNAKTLGFLARPALLEHLNKGTVIGATTSDGALGAYLLYASYPKYIRIVHLCVDERLRRRRIAERLFETLRGATTTQHEIRLNCRRDYPARHLWPKLGFVPIGEKRGRAESGSILTIWKHRLRDPDQLDIFVDEASDSLDVVIDAHILFHLGAPVDNKTAPAHQLLSDFLVGTIRLCVTDEHFQEIDRSSDDAVRAASRASAHRMHRLTSNPDEADRHRMALSAVLSNRTVSDRSDIAHIANTAASVASVFVTEDRRLLRHAEEIRAVSGVRVLDPTALIVELHASAEPEAYVQSRVSGVDVRWERLGADDVAEVCERFATHGETVGRFRETLNPLIAQPERYNAQLLRSQGGMHALRVLEQSSDRLSVALARLARTQGQTFYADFVAADTIRRAVFGRLRLVEARERQLAPELVSSFLKAGFVLGENRMLGRLCVPRATTKEEIVSLAGALIPYAAGQLAPLSPAVLVRHCFPTRMLGDTENLYVVPIRPQYAMQLFDVASSGDDLFGVAQQTLMRSENVYYRARTAQRMIQAPGRVLWYASSPRSEIMGVSHLDEVDIGTPKDLFRQYRKLGVLDWPDVFEMCKKDPSKEIMCLRFSQTFPFPEPVTLEQLRAMEGRPHVAPQSPRKICASLYGSIFDAGLGGAHNEC